MTACGPIQSFPITLTQNRCTPKPGDSQLNGASIVNIAVLNIHARKSS